MAHEKPHQNQSAIDRVLDVVLKLPWLDILNDLWQLACKILQRYCPKSPYGVLEYESTLELLDLEGKHAIFRKREKIRYLQDNIIAYQDQAWGDGKILVNYRCTPGKPVDCYRSGHKWHMLISRREVKSRGDIDVFNIEWEIRNGFLKPTGYWETHVTHATEHLEINVVFPESREIVNTVAPVMWDLRRCYQTVVVYSDGKRPILDSTRTTSYNGSGEFNTTRPTSGT